MQIESNFAEANNRKYPEGVAIALAKDRTGKVNPITLGWFMTTSIQPRMLAISVAHNRHSLDAIRHSKEFVLALPSLAMAEETLYYGTKSGRDTDKLADCSAATQPAMRVDCLLLSDAVVNFECSLSGELTTGDHVIFAGEVLAVHVNQDQSVRRLYTVGPNYKMGGVTPDA